MSITQLDESTFLNLSAIVMVDFAAESDGSGALVYLAGGQTAKLSRSAAVALRQKIRAEVWEQASRTGESAAAMAEFPTKNKAWFVKRDEGRCFIFAFVNQKGSCSVRTFDAETGIALGKIYRAGFYKESFSNLLVGATELVVDSQPNLERDCKQKLPTALHEALKMQF